MISIPALFTPPPPVLGIETASSNAVRLIWPVDDDRPFTLETGANLSNGSRSLQSSPPVVIGASNMVTNAVAGPARYYRLGI